MSTRAEFLKELRNERRISMELLNGGPLQTKKKKKSKPQLKERYIYALELEDGCYYIGQSVNVKARYEKHLNGEGALWTKLHKPIRLIEHYSVGKKTEGATVDDEDYLSYCYVLRYGKNKVRGGRHCKVASW